MSKRHPDNKTNTLFKELSVHPLTIKRWNDFEKLFGKKGACGGCWCMYWRLKRAEFNKFKGEVNKGFMKKRVGENRPPGLLLYADKQLAGWCALAPRNEYPVLNNSRILKAPDDQLVWSIVCFFIDRNFRKSGLTTIFLRYAIEYCKNSGVKIIEGYPIDAKDKKNYPPVFAYTGFASAYIKAGFTEVARRSESRPIMRYYI